MLVNDLTDCNEQYEQCIFESLGSIILQPTIINLLVLVVDLLAAVHAWLQDSFAGQAKASLLSQCAGSPEHCLKVSHIPSPGLPVQYGHSIWP